MKLPEYDNTSPFADIGPVPKKKGSSEFEDEGFVLAAFGLPLLVLACIGLFVASVFGLFN